MKHPKKVEIIEVGPRDGLQNESKFVPTQLKATFIKNLVKAGLKTVEAASFVSPKKIPQMKDASELYEMISSLDVSLPCLVPNKEGFERALELGVKEISFFTATSNTFNKKNTNASIEESLLRFAPIAKECNKNDIKLRAYVSTVFGCPYEGETSIDLLIDVCKKLIDMGAYEISLGDTIGVAHPKQVMDILEKLLKSFDENQLAMHFHDTRGMAVSNVYTSLNYGIFRYDSSAGGIGGCPYANGATGNVATEDLLYLFNSLGIETGVDIKKVFKASKEILDFLGKESPSKYWQYLKGKI